MSTAIDRGDATRPGRIPANPFATRHTKPGAVAPLDHGGTPLDLPRLVRRLRGLRAAAIEGPHGRGKTTLLTALADAAGSAGTPVAVVRLRSRRDAWAALTAIVRAPAGSLVCIDSWERLGPGLAAVARAAARIRACLLLVTSHRATGMPALWRCETTPGLLAAIVARLPDHGGRVSRGDVVEAFARHDGNLRESLYDLYDRFERRVREPTAG